MQPHCLVYPFAHPSIRSNESVGSCPLLVDPRRLSFWNTPLTATTSDSRDGAVGLLWTISGSSMQPGPIGKGVVTVNGRIKRAIQPPSGIAAHRHMRPMA